MTMLERQLKASLVMEGIVDITTGVAESTLACTGTDVAAALEADALADRFQTWAYEGGELDVNGARVQLQWMLGPPPHVKVMFHTGEPDVVLSRETFLELVQAGDVLLRATRTNGRE